MLEVAALDDDIWKSSSCRDAEVYGMVNLDVDFILESRDRVRRDYLFGCAAEKLAVCLIVVSAGNTHIIC
jgi:hypothetical protein